MTEFLPILVQPMILLLLYVKGYIQSNVSQWMPFGQNEAISPFTGNTLVLNNDAQTTSQQCIEPNGAE